MTALHRKLIRDLQGMWAQVAAICLVMASGVAIFVMSLSTLWSLDAGQQNYYRRSQFADVFSHLKRAPRTLQPRIAEIPGVQQVETRIVERATLDMPGLSEPAAGRLVSLPDRRPPLLNRLHLRGGRLPVPGRANEAVVSAGFAEAHQLEPDDRVNAILNGKRQSLLIVGIALSPEYIYQIREGDLMPDDQRFGVFWMSERDLEAAFDMEGAFNDLSLRLTPDASEPEVIRRLDRLTARYGGLSAYGRADQVSHKFVTNELQELSGMAAIAPTIFLCVSSFLLNVVISRMVSTQRSQIATLKAFGYFGYEIGLHYVQVVLVFVAIGTTLGTLVGVWLGHGVTQFYTRFFRFPQLEYVVEPSILVAALLVCGGASIAAAILAVWRASRLPPAEAMWPEAPTNYHPTFLERAGLARLVGPATRMILRQLERRPWRAATSVVGTSLAVAVLILGSFMLDALNYVIESEFTLAQRQDLTVSFVEVTPQQALYNIRRLPGVRDCQPFRAVSIRLQSAHRSRRVALTGLPPDGRLFQLLDVSRRRAEVPREGLVLSSKLAELLHVQPGDVISVQVLEGIRTVADLPIRGVIDDFQGTAAYMHIDSLHRLMREGPTISGLHIAAEQDGLDDLYARLKRAPQIASVTVKGAALRSFQETIAENLLRMRLYNVLFAAIIVVGVVYNSARISLLERSREFATLRVIGFTTHEVSRILLGELAIVVAISIPIGLLTGYGLAALLIEVSYDTELFRMPLVIAPWTYAFAASVTIASAVACGWAVGRQLRGLDLVSVLKTKE
jgi:putative ABC transport system permease protein